MIELTCHLCNFSGINIVRKSTKYVAASPLLPLLVLPILYLKTLHEKKTSGYVHADVIVCEFFIQKYLKFVNTL